MQYQIDFRAPVMVHFILSFFVTRYHRVSTDKNQIDIKGSISSHDTGPISTIIPSVLGAENLEDLSGTISKGRNSGSHRTVLITADNSDSAQLNYPHADDYLGLV
jgi:hypothetical protein